MKTLGYSTFIGISICGLLSGCSQPQIHYSPDDFVNPNRVVTKTVPTNVPTPKINATYGYGNNLAVIKAYDTFTKTGVAKSIDSKGFKTFAYDAYSHPIVICSPLRLCVVQLERNEKINNIDLGDSAHWILGTSLIGSPQNGSYQVVIKPKMAGTATDMVITTNKRTYNIGLLSQQGDASHVINFYYPQETLSNAVAQFHQKATSPIQQQTVSQGTQINLNHVNFNYKIQGDYPAWRPSRIFDDGNKTFIQMPSVTSRMDLPVLYILKNQHMALVNYRYKDPYYIVDGLFKQAYLISGKGSNQVRVDIDNENFS